MVNEQLLRGNSSNTQYPVEGGYLVYFDLGNKNANVAYFIGDSGNKFDGATKDSYRAALTEMDDLTITGLNFTLIGSAETGFNIAMMGSAKDVDSLLAEFTEVGIKTLDNGQKAVGGIEIYNLAGQRMSRLQRGINIVNGKKVIVK